MEEKRLGKNVKALLEISKRSELNQTALSAIDNPNSNLNSWLKSSNHSISEFSKMNNFGSRTFCKLMNQQENTFRFYK